jgi:hypothetical protein
MKPNRHSPQYIRRPAGVCECERHCDDGPVCTDWEDQIQLYLQPDHEPLSANSDKEIILSGQRKNSG